VSHIEALHGDYIQQADQVLARFQQFGPWYKNREQNLEILVDVAGVGTSVKMTLQDRARTHGINVRIRPYSFVASIAPFETKDSVMRMDKSSTYELAYRVAATGLLRIDSELPMASALKIEMENLGVVASPSGRPLINATQGNHDDLTTAVVAAIAYLNHRRPTPIIMRRIPGL
jgi:hypothetical protein